MLEISDRLKQTLKALKEGVIDDEYVEVMDITPEEKQWVFSNMLELNLSGDELESGGTMRTWGTEDSDRIISPLQDHHYVFIAGTQGSGKTTLAFFIAEQNARMGNIVIFYSLEMTHEQIIQRNARETAGITKEQWRDKSLISETQKTRYRNRKKELELSKDFPLLLTGAGDWEDRTIETILKDAETHGGASMIIIDNLDLIETSMRGADNNQRQEHISRTILDWTNENGVPILMIHHMKKGGSGVDGVRGSGKLSDDADMVLLISRPQGEGLAEAEKHQTIITAGKDRDFGDFFIHELYFDKGKFRDDYQGLKSGNTT